MGQPSPGQPRPAQPSPAQPFVLNLWGMLAADVTMSHGGDVIMTTVISAGQHATVTQHNCQARAEAAYGDLLWVGWFPQNCLGLSYSSHGRVGSFYVSTPLDCWSQEPTFWPLSRDGWPLGCGQQGWLPKVSAPHANSAHGTAPWVSAVACLIPG